MTAADRRRAILEALSSDKFTTRANLAFEFGVSKRTIEYDIMYLSLEYPVYTTQGNGGGIHIMDGYHLNRPCMNDKQMALLHKLLLTLSGEDKETMQTIIKNYGGLKK